jgi:peroxiredoxin
MPEDRFENLGEPPRRSAAERFEDEDRLNPEPDMPRPRADAPRPGNRYAWVVGIVMLMVAAVVLLARGVPDSGEGLRGPPKGSTIPAFAAPSATGELDGDANVRQATGGSAAAGKGPACDLRGEDIVNVCDLREKSLVLTFLVTEGGDCEPQVDRVERMRSEFPEVNFAAVVSGEEREEIEQIVRRRGWTLPVAVDRDRAVLNGYGVALCPTTVFAYPGGRVRTVKLGNLTEDQLREQVRKLLEASSRRS